MALPPGERVVGEKPFHFDGRFYFLSTNPTIANGENWLHELVMNTGGEPLKPIFDLSKDGLYDSSDLADNDEIPVAKHLGPGVFSQPRLVNASGLTTTLYAFHPDLPIDESNQDDPGVSGGHFDFDIYYSPTTAGTITFKSTGNSIEQKSICTHKDNVEKHDQEIAPACSATNGFPSINSYLSDYYKHPKANNIKNENCDGSGENKMKWYDLTCDTYTTVTTDGTPLAPRDTYVDFQSRTHKHEYDDKYDVTGVNMLNASVPSFNFDNAIISDTTEFKVLVMNQY